MFIDNYLPEPLGLQKMKNDSTFLLFYHFWFYVFELLTIAAEAGNGFYWDEVQGTTKLKSLNRVVRDITCGFPRRPGNVVLQKELYFLTHSSHMDRPYITQETLSGCLWSVVIPLIILARNFLYILRVRLFYHNNLMVWVYYYFCWPMGKLRH